MSRQKLEKCGVCEQPAILGKCDFGKGNPYFVSTDHCRTCCMRPDRDRWRPLSEIEGMSASHTQMRRILKTYAAAYAGLLGRITNLACGKAIRINTRTS